MFYVQLSEPNANHVRGLHLLALFEAFKGALVMAAGFGLLKYMHGDLQHLSDAAFSIIDHLHINPAQEYSQIFLTAVANVTDQNILWIAIGAMAYSTIRFVEAYGLWTNRRWAEWLAIISTGLYIPLEVFEMAKSFSWLKTGITAFNIFIVIYLFYIRFWKKHSGN